MSIKFSFLTLVVFISCNREVIIQEPCVVEFREIMNITSAEEYPDDCETYFELHQSQEIFFFLIGSNCIDFEAIPLGCDGEALCPALEARDCNSILMQSQFVRVIGFIK